MLDDETFQLVRECFEENDGSLPGVELNGLTPQQVAAIYAAIRERSHIWGDAPQF